LIAVTLPSFFELAWVLRKVYGFWSEDIAQEVLALIATANVEMNRPAVLAGLAVLDAGGDFADGVNA